MTFAATAISAALVAPQLASSAPRDLRAEREKVRAEQAAVAAELDTTKASKAEIDAALSALQADLDTQQAALDKATADLADAERDLAEAEEAIERLTAEVATLRDEMARRAIQAYVNPPEDDLLSALEQDDFTSATEQTFYADLRSQGDADLEDRLEGAQVDLDAQREAATDARERAAEQKQEQAERTEAVRVAKERQEALAARLQATIDDQIARSIELAKTNRKLSAQIAKEQAELQARLAAAVKRSKEEQARRAREDARAYSNVEPSGKESAPTGGGGGGGGSVSSSPGGSDGGITLAYIQGVPVNAQIADQVVAMINAAAADGVNLTIGNSYRTIPHQIELRKKHCGTSHYAIYEMPSGSCRPPTARPGASQHQLGLAIDFANCGSRSTACYTWLAANASRFGLYNYPREAWHWSTTGS